MASGGGRDVRTPRTKAVDRDGSDNQERGQTERHRRAGEGVERVRSDEHRPGEDHHQHAADQLQDAGVVLLHLRRSQGDHRRAEDDELVEQEGREVQREERDGSGPRDVTRRQHVRPHERQPGSARRLGERHADGERRGPTEHRRQRSVREREATHPAVHAGLALGRHGERWPPVRDVLLQVQHAEGAGDRRDRDPDPGELAGVVERAVRAQHVQPVER